MFAEGAVVGRTMKPKGNLSRVEPTVPLFRRARDANNTVDVKR